MSDERLTDQFYEIVDLIDDQLERDSERILAESRRLLKETEVEGTKIQRISQRIVSNETSELAPEQSTTF